MKQTVLHQKHLELKAAMTDFQGWHVPQSYTDAQEEYLAVRTAAGLFDAGFLGRIEISGPDAVALLQLVFTRNMEQMPERSAQYGFLCNESGYVLDDAVLFRLADDQQGRRFLLTTNAVNTDKILSWLKQHASGGARISDVTRSVAQFGVQGPLSTQVLQKFLAHTLKKFKPQTVREMKAPETTLIISRTGFAGEYGYELFLPAENAPGVWDEIMHSGREFGIMPCGTASREILRIEAGYLLYGADIDESRTPLDICAGGLVDFQKNFIGRDTLLRLRAEGPRQKLAGFVLTEKNAPRSGSSIFSENHEIGLVTSGTVSPSLRKGIGLGYVVTRYSQPGQEIEIEVRDREIAARIVELPFYRKK